LADYKALQAELEAQAALDAEEAEDGDELDDADEVEDADDVDEAEEAVDSTLAMDGEDDSVVSEPEGEDSALANVEEGVEPEADAGKTRKRPRFLRRRNRGASKKKNDES
jgi:hypothetical protein